MNIKETFEWCIAMRLLRIARLLWQYANVKIEGWVTLITFRPIFFFRFEVPFQWWRFRSWFKRFLNRTGQK